MKARIYGIFGSAALLAGFAVACRNDPTADGVGAPAEVILDFSALRLSQGDSATIEARIVDNRLTPLVGDITFRSCDAATATVSPNTSFNPVPPTAAQATVHALGANATCIVAEASGAKPDSVSVIVLPTSFAGTLSSTTPKGGDTLTINSTSALKFDPATVAVTFGGGEPGTIVSATADVVKVLVPFSDAGSLTIDNVVVTYVAGLKVSLNTVASVTQTGAALTGTSDWSTAPDITGLLPAVGSDAQFIADLPASNPANACPEDRFQFGPSGPCAFFKFTLATPDTVYFTADWDGGSGDVDLVICSDSTAANFSTTTFVPCITDGLTGASSAKPETAGKKLYAAGTYWFVAQDYDGGGVRNFFVTIKLR